MGNWKPAIETGIRKLGSCKLVTGTLEAWNLELETGKLETGEWVSVHKSLSLLGNWKLETWKLEPWEMETGNLKLETGDHEKLETGN